MIRLNHPYKCRWCGKPYAIILGRGLFNSFLPVEIVNGTEQDDLEYDKSKHTSHLLNCPQLQAQWLEVKEKIMMELKQKDKFEMEDLMK